MKGIYLTIVILWALSGIAWILNALAIVGGITFAPLKPAAAFIAKNILAYGPSWFFFPFVMWVGLSLFMESIVIFRVWTLDLLREAGFRSKRPRKVKEEPPTMKDWEG